MIYATLLIVLTLVSGVYIFRRADYSAANDTAFDRWIYFHGDTLWERIGLLGKLSALSLVGVIGGVIWLDVITPKGQVSSATFYPSNGPTYLLWGSAIALALFLLTSLIATILHRLHDVQDERPGRILIGYAVSLGLISGVIAALSISEIPDGTVPTLFKKAITLDLRDEMVEAVMRRIEIANPQFYLYALTSSVAAKVSVSLIAILNVLAVLSHRGWRNAVDLTRRVIYPFAAVMFGLSFSAIFTCLGIAATGYVLTFILGIVSLIAGIFVFILMLQVVGQTLRQSAAEAARDAKRGYDAPSYSSGASSDEVTTVFRDEDGNTYEGKGSSPDSIFGGSFCDRATYDRGLDGDYHERWGNRILHRE